jgi:uncharacterized membrane protein
MKDVNVLADPNTIPAHCVVRRIGPADLKDSLTKGANDFLPILEFLGKPLGWTLIILGNAIGFVFAVAVLTISVVSFPLLLDRNVGVAVAVRTSVRAVLANPLTMALWGLIVSVSLVIGFVFAFVGLAFVTPILAHASWHLYRRVVQ